MVTSFCSYFVREVVGGKPRKILVHHHFWATTLPPLPPTFVNSYGLYKRFCYHLGLICYHLYHLWIFAGGKLPPGLVRKVVSYHQGMVVSYHQPDLLIFSVDIGTAKC